MAAVMPAVENGGLAGMTSLFDVGAFKTYLASLLQPMMTASRAELEVSLFDDPTFEEKVMRFASDPSIMVAYVTQTRTLVELTVEDEEPSTFIGYELCLPPLPSYSPNLMSTLSLIKRTTTLTTSLPLGSQLHFMLLSAAATATSIKAIGQDGVDDAGNVDLANNAPYESLHSVMHWGVTPWFEAYITSKKDGHAIDGLGSKKGGEAQTGIPVAKRKFAELELSLLHLQQNVEIPEVQLVVDSAIRRAIERARAARKGPATLDDIQPPSLLSDTQFLNKLQSDVNVWIKEVQTVTKLSRDVASGTASQEINFWLSMDKALEATAVQLASDDVQLALEVLKNAKRFHATMSFFSDTGLKEAQDTVHKYNQLMKDFPLNDLLSATDLDKIRESLYLIFSHINKKLKVSPYPLRRTLPLVEAISRDFNDQLLKVLNSQRLMFMDYEMFERTMASVGDVFSTWDENIKEFTNVAREVMRKRSEKFIPVKVNSAHAKLQERTTYLRGFRRTHEQLRVMTEPARGLKSLGSESLTDLDMEDEVRLAYNSVKGVDVLDVSVSGTEIWVTAENAYNERVARVENQIISRLRDKLGTARNAHEMFCVFSKFNSLFVRPKIRGAIQGYQVQLIDSVKEDIKDLHGKFTNNYRDSEAYHMAQLRDIPPVAGAIIWARQIERQLDADMKRVEDVLGKGWELYAEGEKLEAESASFRRKLNTTPIYEAWIQDTTRREPKVGGRLLDIVRQRNVAVSVSGHTPLEVAVNFDPQAIALFKEVRNLLWLGFSVPHLITNFAKEAKRVYPFAVGLMESVRTYNQMVELIDKNPAISTLMTDLRVLAQELISRGFNLRWETIPFYAYQKSLPAGLDRNEDTSLGYFKEFNSLASSMQDKITTLLEIWEQVNSAVEELETCSYFYDAFEEILVRIQSVIDRLNLEGFANLDPWVSQLEERIRTILVRRLTTEILAWCHNFQAAGQDDQQAGQGVSVSAAGGETSDVRGIKPLVHEIRIRNQVLYLEPPLESAKAICLKDLHGVIGVICDQTKLKSTRYELTLQMQSDGSADNTYSSLLWEIDEKTLRLPLSIIADKIETVREYVEKWLQFQALWDLDGDFLYDRLGDSLVSWAQLLTEIRESRSTFDTSETRKDFGVCIVDYTNVQSKVNTRYDTWQREILIKYGQKLGMTMRDVYGAVVQARHDLEQQSIEGTATAQAVVFITFMQELKRKVANWSPQIDTFTRGQQLLERQRFPFPGDWLHADQLEGEWLAFSEIMRRKDASIQEQLGGLQLKVIAEEKIIDSRIIELQSDWEANKPIQGGIKVEVATNTINVFEARLTKLQDDHNLVSRAKSALELGNKRDQRLTPIAEELRDLKAVWIALSGIWDQLRELRDSAWSTVQPRKLRQFFDGILSSTKEMPSRMRQYAAFEYVQDVIKDLLKSNALISDLRSDALRERHWRQLMQIMRIGKTVRLSSMTLGDVYDLDLKKNEQAVKEVVLQAQGEMALEEFLRQVKDTWTSYSLELVNYQNKCRLIRGWDELFAKCGEHLNSLTAMRMSPHYRVFEQDASSWEEKLNRVHVLFDIWIDVQRQWVYLEGIFSGSADMKHLLPIESTRFGNINSEFMAVMKKVYKSPLIVDVIGIPGVQKTLERLVETLGKIQKALGEYLERERSSFPRFYFIGDEDLLEIIGNSKDMVRTLKHLKKMFAGLSSVTLDDDVTVIKGMIAAEGEEVPFPTPIVLANYPRVNDWLAQVEKSMRLTLAQMLRTSVAGLSKLFDTPDRPTAQSLLQWIEGTPAQLSILASQVLWTRSVSKAFEGDSFPAGELDRIEWCLGVLADAVLSDLPALLRRKCEHLITELVHQRNVVRTLVLNGVKSASNFAWLYHMRYYLDEAAQDPVLSLTVEMADASFVYGFEYLGVPDRLVQTPLTDKCFLTLTQALNNHLGGSPFGPAGTGKTESVKSLGQQLGRFVLVFCCDESFDFQAMGRIFVGLCQVGAWGCFDEFNRLEERMLSAVSQQIQNIQEGLLSAASDEDTEIDIVGRKLKLHRRTGIFITMNPGYAGRSNLPDNLKKLFRSMAMTRPDGQLIAQVMLFSQGFRSAETIAEKIVPFFKLCDEQLSKQPHYDFGLRALKAVLATAGTLKRHAAQTVKAAEEDISSFEQGLTMRSIKETLVPKLVTDDVTLLTSLLADVFPGVEAAPANLTSLSQAIAQVCDERHLVMGDAWMAKIIQLYQVQQTAHGLVMVGPPASGKSRAWQVLLAALEKLDNIEGVSYVIDPKSLHKDSLYGTLDHTTREWSDGLFTHILRKIVDDVRGESSKRHWIIFDGDVDPEWVENLNSLLDDNKLLTLPNGERLSLPPNVRIMFEVEHLRYATLATVSRCGMIWFSENVVSREMISQNHLKRLQNVQLELEDDERPQGRQLSSGPLQSASLEQRQIATILEAYFVTGGIVHQAMDFAATLSHIMDFSEARCLSTLFSLLNKVTRRLLTHQQQHSHFAMTKEQVQRYVHKALILSIIWALTGDAPASARSQLSAFVTARSSVDLPTELSKEQTIIDFDIDLPASNWVAWQTRVPTIDIDTHAVTSAEVVVPTVDTVRHEDVLYSWLSERKPVILCGPPGSGKTMTLFSSLRKLPDVEIAGLNFSSATTPELILKTFEQYCEYRKTSNGMVLSPFSPGRWLVVFCDEINLPALDKYGTQRVISFMRQMIESGGFWRASDLSWIQLDRIQFVGACNPPTDPGRIPLSQRFLRHAPVVMVDYPGRTSLQQIYGTFNRALLKLVPTLRGYEQALTGAMVDFYEASASRFSAEQQAHYIYSPRELTRWTRGIYESLKPLDSLDVEGLVRIWAHEALRLFQDRLVHQSERTWTDSEVDAVALRHFPNIDHQKALARPILFSNWTTKNYVPVDREALREYSKARLRIFHEEELDVQLVLFNDVLDHVLRIDRVFRQTQGHLLLIGISGAGKTTLSRFVAWMNGLSIYQIKVSNRYTGEDFDNDLRHVLRRAGCKAEKICFIMDESNVLDSGFLERMNTLLANAEIPGLFEGDEYAALMTACKEGSQRDGLILDSPEELYRWFTQQVAKNLHVVFTMNPPRDGLSDRAATSPALFNRCVLDWFGDWSDEALFQVGMEMTSRLDLDQQGYVPTESFPVAYRQLSLPPSHRSAVINALVAVHQSVQQLSTHFVKKSGGGNFATPRHFLDFIGQFVRLHTQKREELEEEQRHLNVGLEKLRTTVLQVEDLRVSLTAKERLLKEKDAQANTKLRQMVANQQEAEAKKVASIRIQAALTEQDRMIAERKSAVMAELAEAQPAVEQASAAVGNIKKQHLSEVRTMPNPPEAVKIAMESACSVLGYHIDSWKTVQGLIRRDDFISSIQHFDTNKMSKAVRDRMERDYIGKPSFNYEVVNRASRACGPLVQWVIAQVHFSGILDKIEPLRQEVEALEHEAYTTKEQAIVAEETIAQLEESIAGFKDEYASLISETQALKGEMERVQAKVDRSMTLISSLSSEQERWDAGSKTFEAEMSTLVGDVLLSSGFIAYAGYFDQHYRERLWSEWSEHLAAAGIRFKQGLSVQEYLSTADQRLQWQADALPNDSLCTENAIMLSSFQRYPLVIDPSGQATTFITNTYRDRKIVVTSFLDAAFLKSLESALRFGNPILIQDAESLDPILNSILNKEMHRTGGRVLIRLGSQEIDISPSFTLFLVTRDPTAVFSPDICSRVTFVNFTMTRASLQSQSLDKALTAERPETETKRRDLIKVQGEFRVRLRQLERSLLQTLNESTGNLLDDDAVIQTLEVLKNEAKEIANKVQQTDTTMQEIEQVTAEYMPLAQASSAIYFMLEQLSEVHHFYQFSLRFFLDIFESSLLRNPHLDSITDPRQRRDIILRDLFVFTFQRTVRSLLHEDYPVLALNLVRLKMRVSGDSETADELDELLESDGVQDGSSAAAELASVLPKEVAARLSGLRHLPDFPTIFQHILQQPDLWRMCLQSERPESFVPFIGADLQGVRAKARTAVIIQCLRPDRLPETISAIANEAFSIDLMAIASYDLQTIVSMEIPASTPLALCSVAGFDAGYRIEALVQATGAHCTSVAMGSDEGLTLADRAIADAARTGSWVLLKNTHLASAWLGQLEKRLQTITPHPDFRMFLTMETVPSVPVSVLRQARILMNEPLPGVRANIIDTLISIPEHRLQSGPAEKGRLYLMLAWLHAVVQERLRYTPLGWSKVYEFNDADLSAALATIDSWLNRVAQGRANIGPASIPWPALRSLLKHAVYGGRVDSDFDQQILDTFIDALFDPKVYEANFALVKGDSDSPTLCLPEGTSMDSFKAWARDLPEKEPASWLHLPAAGEKTTAMVQGRRLMSKLHVMRSDVDFDEEPTDEQGKEQRPAWMATLQAQCEAYQASLKNIELPAKPDAQGDVLSRFFSRELAIASRLLKQVLLDLSMVIGVCSRTIRPTNDSRALCSSLAKGTLPTTWKAYAVRRHMPVSLWISDFKSRLDHLHQLASSLTSVDIGLLFQPEAYITATQQAVAQRNKSSLEQLKMSFGPVTSGDAEAFVLKGLVIEGGSIVSGLLKLNDGEEVSAGPCQIRWQLADKIRASSETTVTLPLYLNGDRDKVLVAVDVEVTGASRSLVIQRGCCFKAST